MISCSMNDTSGIDWVWVLGRLAHTWRCRAPVGGCPLANVFRPFRAGVRGTRRLPRALPPRALPQAVAPPRALRQGVAPPGRCARALPPQGVAPGRCPPRALRQGVAPPGRCLPRALPWADMFRPYGAIMRKPCAGWSVGTVPYFAPQGPNKSAQGNALGALGRWGAGALGRWGAGALGRWGAGALGALFCPAGAEKISPGQRPGGAGGAGALGAPAHTTASSSIREAARGRHRSGWRQTRGRY
jgi:hypothetical protein